MRFSDEINAEIALNEHMHRIEIERRLALREWTMRNGKRILIKDMTDSHLENTIRLIKRDPNMEDSYCEYIPYMQAELNARAKRR